MVEYINSNDDAGNMALYAGLGLAAFAGGAALAYRATSPIYNDAASGKKQTPGLARYDSNGGKNPASFLRGAFKGATLGLLSKEVRDNALSEMAQSVSDNAASRIGKELEAGTGDYAKKFGVVSDSYNKGLSSLGADVASAESIINNAPKGGKPITAQGAVDKVLQSNPNSLLEVADVQKRLDRSANPQLSQADLQVQDVNRYAELQAEAQRYRDNGQMTPVGRQNLQDEWLQAKDAHEGEKARKESTKNTIEATEKQQLQDDWLKAKDQHEASKNRIEAAKQQVAQEVEADRKVRADRAETDPLVKEAEAKALRNDWLEAKDKHMAKNNGARPVNRRKGNAYDTPDHRLSTHAANIAGDVLSLSPGSSTEQVLRNLPSGMRTGAPANRVEQMVGRSNARNGVVNSPRPHTAGNIGKMSPRGLNRSEIDNLNARAERYRTAPNTFNPPINPGSGKPYGEKSKTYINAKQNFETRRADHLRGRGKVARFANMSKLFRG